MRILVTGGGGREHALTWALSRSGEHRLFGAPGNPGMGKLAQLFPVSATDIDGVVELAEEQEIDLVVVGPEAPLVMGMADSLRAAGVPCFGPGMEAAGLEGSKWFAKDVMKAASVPTAAGETFTDTEPAMDYMGGDASSYVLKADGLAAGKGVFLPGDGEEARGILDGLFSGGLGDAGLKVVVERRLTGREVSVLAVCSGTECLILPPSRDHKRLGERDTGPNTGGMGAICPPPGLEEGFSAMARDRVVLPVLHELASRGIDYRGVLYAGLMLTGEGPMVLEFNVRFGDPETQAVLPMLEGDLAGICMSAALGQELPSDLHIMEGACACVVMASGGYPASYRKGYRIHGLGDVDEALVFHAGTSLSEGELVTAGGRVLSVAALGRDLPDAIGRAYGEIGKVSFRDNYYRKDIGG